MRSKFVCQRCGVPVALWGKAHGTTDYWKHQNGGRGTPSCGMPPVVVTRAEYEAGLTTALQRAIDNLAGKKPRKPA